MRALGIVCGMVCVLARALPADAQIGSIAKGLQKAQQVHDDLTFTDAEEQKLGADISAKLRDKYGVVQDQAVHKYVTLVGRALAASSSRPSLAWTFIVLDTDGVNAFAAPGGFIHITRGALALLDNEAELADVLAHEISHVVLKHTIKAIQKEKVIALGAEATRQDVLNQAANRGYAILFENAFDRKDEMDADKGGVMLASSLGYAPTGLGAFLARLADRDKDLKDRSGLFASHPETQARLDGLTQVIKANKLTATATVAPRFHEAIAFKPAEISGVPGSGQTRTGGKFGLSGLGPLGNEKTSNQTIASAGSRGVNPDRDAKGGPIKTLVVVTVTPAEITAFVKGIVG
jgi:predicted Zn-dependent protease